MSSKWVKPNGTVIEINDNAIEYAKSLGWKLYVKAPPKKTGKKAATKAK